MNIENKLKNYKSDYHLIYSCQYHVIFCTKYRRKVLIDGADTRLKEIIINEQEKLKFNIIEMEVMNDHVHLLLDVHPKVGIFNTVNRIKGASSKILRQEFKFIRSRIPTLWTRSKFISTVGSVSLEIVKKYIEEQKNV